MASPFRVFRKHQKAMLAVLGLMAMIAFVFLPIIMDQMATRSMENPVVVTTTQYGDITRSQLWQMLHRRQVLFGFLQRVQMAVREAGGTGQEAQRLLYQVGDTTEETAVNMWLLSQKAQELGVTVDDSAVNDLLNGITEQRLSSQDIQKILRDFRITQATLFDALQTELLAMRMQAMFASSLAATTPAQGWDFYQRLNRKGTVELVEIPVARFADRVPDPEEKTLREFFNQHKDRLPDPATPEPGFRIPRRIAVEYLKADYEKVLETVEVSDEEIRKYYEEHKENYKREELPAAQPKQPSASEAKQEPESPQPAAKPEEKPQSEPVKDAAALKPAEKTAENAAAAKPASAEQAKPEEKAVEEKPAAEDSSAVRPVSPFMLASYQEEEPPADRPPAEPAKKPEEKQAEKSAEDKPAGEPEKPAESKPADKTETSEKQAGPELMPQQPAPPEKSEPAAEEKPVDTAEAAAEKRAEKKTAETKTVDEKPAAEKPVTEKPAEEKPATEKPATEKPATEKPATEKPATEKPVTEKPAAAAEAPKAPSYLPLEEVREEIRRQLARERARAKIDELLQQAQEQMAVYHNQWIVYDATVQEEGAGSKSPPVKPELAKLAEGTPLTAQQTGLVSRVEVMQLDIGDSWVSSAPFTEHAYATNLLKFKPSISQDNDGNSYLFWKTDEAEEREPDFEDPQVRQEVLRQWKLVQARALATQEAEKLAEEARKSGKTFKEFFAGRQDAQVIEAGPFTWLTYGDLPPMYWLQSQQPPRISEVEGVGSAGPDFMRTVFRLEAGGIGVAMNHPQTSAYVVRAVEFNPLPDVLWTLFLEDPLSRYMAAAQDRREVVSDWMQGIKDSVGFQWLEKPDQAAPRAAY